MTRRDGTAPAGPRWGQAGVFVLAAAVLAGACDRLAPDRGPQSLELHGDTVELAAGIALLEVELGTTTDGGSEIRPARIEARPGDVVRFTTRDGRLHALAFRTDALSAQARTFLEQTGQLRGPPLVEAGTQWVLNLEGAPEGEYPFTCTSHGAHATLVVRTPQR